MIRRKKFLRIGKVWIKFKQKGHKKGLFIG